MHFCTNWNNGYEVGVIMLHQGVLKFWPLRNFYSEGDANTFKYHDCPRLSDKMIERLCKGYNPQIIFDRISETCFRPHRDRR